MTHKPRIHRAETLRLHGSPGEAISLDDYIASARGEVSAADVLELKTFRDRIADKLQTEQARQHHDLVEGTEILLSHLDSRKWEDHTGPFPVHIAEAVVGLSYLLRGVDLIPDSIPEIGLTDDARLIARVLARNPELRAA